MKFIYLIQGTEVIVPPMRGNVIQLTWKTENPNAIFFPNSTWTEGRNRLLEEALKTDCDYFIFMDDDVRLCDLQNNLNDYFLFEHFLKKWKPSMGYVRYAWQEVAENAEVNTGQNVDALFNAFHRETIGTVLPYSQWLDSECWYYSQYIVNQLNNIMYADTRLMYNKLLAVNGGAPGVYRPADWDRVYNLVCEAVKLEYRYLVQHNFKPANFVSPKKHADHRRTREQMSEYFDLDHPLFEQHRKFWT
jgi:hypothetical protein